MILIKYSFCNSIRKCTDNNSSPEIVDEMRENYTDLYNEFKDIFEMNEEIEDEI